MAHITVGMSITIERDGKALKFAKLEAKLSDVYLDLPFEEQIKNLSEYGAASFSKIADIIADKARIMNLE